MLVQKTLFLSSKVAQSTLEAAGTQMSLLQVHPEKKNVTLGANRCLYKIIEYRLYFVSYLSLAAKRSVWPQSWHWKRFPTLTAPETCSLLM